MNRSERPDGAFIEPGGENAEAVLGIAANILDRLLTPDTVRSLEEVRDGFDDGRGQTGLSEF